MRCIIAISIILGLIFCSTHVGARANRPHQQNPISEVEASAEDDDSSSEEFEKFRRATVSVLLDSDSEETTDQLLMRAKLLAYVEKLKAKETKKKLKADKKAAKEKVFLAAYLAAHPTTTTPTPAAPSTDSILATTESSISASDESTEESAESTVKDARATFNITVSDSAETSDDLLMRAKLVAFVEKLKATETKKNLKANIKAEKAKAKAEKEKAFIAMFLAASGVTTPAPDADADATTATPAVARRQVATADSTASLLAQAKLDAYVAKLKAKQEKAKLKADKKAAKQAMFSAYLAQAANASAYAVPASATGILPGGSVAPAPVPVLPFPGAIGLWNKSMFLNGLFTAMANANAAATAPAATPAPAATSLPIATTPAPIPAAVAAANSVPAVAAATNAEEDADANAEDDADANANTETVDIAKRYAPAHTWDKDSGEDSVESEESADSAAPAVPAPLPVAKSHPKQHYANYKSAGPSSYRDQQILDFWKKYNNDNGIEDEVRGDYIPSQRTDIGNRLKPGATNDFKTGPAGSPNGVGYAESPVSQAGCSGSHIHSCSGMTVYINKPEGNDSAEQKNKEQSPAEARDQTTSPRKHHHRKGGNSKRSAIAA